MGTCSSCLSFAVKTEARLRRRQYTSVVEQGFHLELVQEFLRIFLQASQSAASCKLYGIKLFLLTSITKLKASKSLTNFLKIHSSNQNINGFECHGVESKNPCRDSPIHFFQCSIKNFASDSFKNLLGNFCQGSFSNPSCYYSQLFLIDISYLDDDLKKPIVKIGSRGYLDGPLDYICARFVFYI